MIYLISPPNIKDIKAFAKLLDEVLKTGCISSFQLRLKTQPYGKVSDDILARTAKYLLPICIDNDAAFIVNDNPKVALDVGADGVHLGEDDMSIAEARAMVEGENMIIGASCYDSKHLAYEAGEAGADYVAFGAFYPTSSKPAEKLREASPELLRVWAETTELPCVAIGGINETNAKSLLDAGADMVAVLSYIWQHPKGAAEAAKLLHEAL